MATLEACSYRLKHGNQASTSSKRVIFVKLTDSAMKAFQDVKQNQEWNQASISIGEREGCIQLPSGDVFNFAVADIPTDVPKGSFECIQKTGKGIVEPLGDIRQRITIHATEDSFNNTKQKMTLAEEESKKSCAKEIESSRTGPNIGSRVKVKRGSEQLPLATCNKKLRADMAAVNTPFGAARKKPFSSQSAIKPATAYPSKPSAGNSNGSSATAPFLPVQNPARVPPTGVAVLSTPELGAAANPSPLPVRSPANQAQPQLRPLKERVIHTLALKAFGKVDFLQKLSKFGFKEEERSSLDEILRETAVFKDGRYDILSGILVSQVDPKWPFYNPSDCLMVQKRLSMVENNRPAVASSVIDKNGGNSLTKSSSACDLSNISVKGGKPAGDGHGQKSKADGRSPHDSARSFLAHANDEAISPPPSSSSTCSTPSPPDHSKLKEIGNRNPVKKASVNVNADDLFGSHDDRISSASTDDECYRDSLEARYGVIKTSDQRRQYKRDFYSVYNEYKDLHEQMTHISSKFSDLEGKLRQTKTGSLEYRGVARNIKDDYLQLKSDEDYKKKRKRWEFLTTKLTVIKQQIKTYDVTQVKA